MPPKDFLFTSHPAKYFRLCWITCFSVFLAASANSQNSRFSEDYPMATPSESHFELKPEYEKTTAAILGGVKMANKGTTPTKGDDPEAYTKTDYNTTVEKMIVYADELAASLIKNQAAQAAHWQAQQKALKEVSKSVKSSKYTEAEAAIAKLGIDKGVDPEKMYFIWKDYMEFKDKNVPWLAKENLDATKRYRSLLSYVHKNYDRPFGPQAEQGAVLADVAQALSNSMESPGDLAWQGEEKMTMKAEDELRRLASNIAYYEWRLHDPINGQRSAQIDRATVRHLYQALYDAVRSMVADKTDWHKDPAHGKNLQQLYRSTKAHGWDVNGDKAKKWDGEALSKKNKDVDYRASRWILVGMDD